jgi:hypothetical protein
MRIKGEAEEHHTAEKQDGEIGGKQIKWVGAMAVKTCRTRSHKSSDWRSAFVHGI